MTTSLQPACPRRLLLQLLLLTAIGDTTVRSQTLNFTLMPASCDSGLLQNVDNIIIHGVIDMQGTADKRTLYSLQVESTFDNQSFTHVCSTVFKSSDCVHTTMYGCYCTGASASGPAVRVFIKQRATVANNGTFYRLRFNWTVSSTEKSVFVRIPHMYGEANSSVMVNNRMYYLSGNLRCTLDMTALNSDTGITFCTRNLNVPVLAVACAEDDITYYVNQECAVYKVKPGKNSSGLAINFTYWDNCNRFHTFICFVGENTVLEVYNQDLRNNTIPIITGAAMALVLLLSVVFSLCNGTRDNTGVAIVARGRIYKRSLVETSSDEGSSQSVNLPEKEKMRNELTDMKRSATCTETQQLELANSVSSL